MKVVVECADNALCGLQGLSVCMRWRFVGFGVTRGCGAAGDQVKTSTALTIADGRCMFNCAGHKCVKKGGRSKNFELGEGRFRFYKRERINGE